MRYSAYGVDKELNSILSFTRPYKILCDFALDSF